MPRISGPQTKNTLISPHQHRRKVAEYRQQLSQLEKRTNGSLAVRLHVLLYVDSMKPPLCRRAQGGSRGFLDTQWPSERFRGAFGAANIQRPFVVAEKATEYPSAPPVVARDFYAEYSAQREGWKYSWSFLPWAACFVRLHVRFLCFYVVFSTRRVPRIYSSDGSHAAEPGSISTCPCLQISRHLHNRDRDYWGLNT